MIGLRIRWKAILEKGQYLGDGIPVEAEALSDYTYGHLLCKWYGTVQTNGIMLICVHIVLCCIHNAC